MISIPKISPITHKSYTEICIKNVKVPKFQKITMNIWAGLKKPLLKFANPNLIRKYYLCFLRAPATLGSHNL